MHRVNFFISSESMYFLDALPGTLSEHLRRAVDDYIIKIKGTKVSESVSKKKESETV